MSDKSYREQVEITGSVYQINIESRTFKMKTDDGLKVTAALHRRNQVPGN